MTPVPRTILRILAVAALVCPCQGQGNSGRPSLSAFGSESARAHFLEFDSTLDFAAATLDEAADKAAKQHREILGRLKDLCTVLGCEFSIRLPVRRVNSIRWLADNMSSTTTFSTSEGDALGEPSVSVTYRLRIPWCGDPGDAEALAAQSASHSGLKLLDLTVPEHAEHDPSNGARLVASEDSMARARIKAREKSFRALSASVDRANSSLDRWPELQVAQREADNSVHAVCTAYAKPASGSSPVIGASVTLTVDVSFSRRVLVCDVAASGTEPSESAKALSLTLDAIEESLAGAGRPADLRGDVSILCSEGEVQDGTLTFDTRVEPRMQFFWHSPLVVGLSGEAGADPEPVLREAVRLVHALRECGTHFYGGRPPLSTIADRGFGFRVEHSAKTGVIQRRPGAEDAEAAEAAAAARAYSRALEAAAHLAELSGRKLGSLLGIELRTEPGDGGGTLAVTIFAAWESLPG